ncbi:hypothetical protein N9064_00560 [bacterium]|nr:hypothetical protein [bacterium]
MVEECIDGVELTFTAKVEPCGNGWFVRDDFDEIYLTSKDLDILTKWWLERKVKINSK